MRYNTNMVSIYCSLPLAQFSTHAPIHPRFSFSYRPSTNTHIVQKGPQVKLYAPQRANQEAKWNFVRGSKISNMKQFRKFMYKKAWPKSIVCGNSQIATTLFNLGTATVLPLYALMLIAPKQKMTKTTMESPLPYVILGLLYAYALALSWTPQHLGALFGGNNMMPDLSLIFSRVDVLFFSELSTTAAWIHQLLVDLFGARQVFLDGLENEVETRHSVTLCLFFGPFGILSHVVTKALARMSRS